MTGLIGSGHAALLMEHLQWDALVAPTCKLLAALGLICLSAAKRFDTFLGVLCISSSSPLVLTPPSIFLSAEFVQLYS